MKYTLIKRSKLKYVSASILLFTANVLFGQTTYQAEDADLIFHGIVETEHAGHTGNGYVNLDNETGSYLQWLVSMADSAEQEITFYFAQGADGQDRKMELMINGQVAAAEISFTYTAAWTTWQTQTVNVVLSEGLNVVRLTSLTSNGGPNLDKADISGEQGPSFYRLSTSLVGEGSIQVQPNDSLFSSGTEITLTAAAAEGHHFVKWSGDISSNENPLLFTIEQPLSLQALFVPDDIVLPADTLIGWASLNGGTTGGEGGTVVTVTNQSELESYASGSAKYIIQIEGTIEVTPYGKEINIGSNKTILGIAGNATIKGGGLGIKNVNNVIVRNLIIRDTYETWEGKDTDYDGIEINNSKNVWIDHCEITHCDDGAIDVKNAADFVTISWTRFYNHNKVMLIGAGDDATQDIDHLNTTVHHCWFDGNGDNGLGQRLPRGRFGKIHVFNNYYNDIIYSGAMAGFDADMQIENNYFLNTPDPHPVVGGPTGGDNKMKASGNIYVNSNGRRDERGTAFNPAEYYSYTLHDAGDIPLLVMSNAGVQMVTAIDPRKNYTGQPRDIILFSNYPNPFNPETTIFYQLNKSLSVELALFDASGRKIKTLVQGRQSAGRYSVQWQADDVASGVYYCRLKTAEVVRSIKMILIK